MPVNGFHPLVEFILYQLVLARAEVSEETLGEDHGITQDLFWILVSFPDAAEA